MKILKQQLLNCKKKFKLLELKSDIGNRYMI